MTAAVLGATLLGCAVLFCKEVHENLGWYDLREVAEGFLLKLLATVILTACLMVLSLTFA